MGNTRKWKCKPKTLSIQNPKQRAETYGKSEKMIYEEYCTDTLVDRLHSKMLVGVNIKSNT